MTTCERCDKEVMPSMIKAIGISGGYGRFYCPRCSLVVYMTQSRSLFGMDTTAEDVDKMISQLIATTTVTAPPLDSNP